MASYSFPVDDTEDPSADLRGSKISLWWRILIFDYGHMLRCS